MKKFLQKIFGLALLSVLTFTYNADASHIASAHMYADYISPLKYKITLELYRDCAGIPMSTTQTITVNSSCGSLGQVTLNRDTFYVEQGALCPNVASTCTSPSSQFNGYEKHLYSAEVTLPLNCTDWTFTWNTCCRNQAIMNLANASTLDVCINLIMNTSARAVNSTPRYLELPIPYICVNQVWDYINLPSDAPENDSLVSFNINPRGMNSGVCNNPLAYNGGYSLANPIASAPIPYVVDPVTATAHFRATVQGAFALAFRTVEYDPNTGVFLSSVERDVQVNVVNCNTPPPTIDSFAVTGNPGLYTFLDSLEGGVLLSNRPIEVTVCPGTTLKFNIKGISNSVSNALYLYAKNLNIICPGATLTPLPVQGSSPLTGKFNWTPTPADIGNHTVVFSFMDSTCTASLPIKLYSTISMNIKVLPGVDAGPDWDYCGITSDTVEINATGPQGVTQWTWIDNNTGTTPTNMSPTSGPNVKAWPSTTTDYILTTDAQTGCKNSDTVHVEVHAPITVDAGPDATICANQNHQMAANVGPYSYLAWSPNYNLVNNLSPTTIAFPTISTNYTLEVVDNNNCTYHDDVMINVNGVAPNLNAWADQDTICPDGTVGLHAVAFAQTCGLAQAACSGTYNNATLNAGQTVSNAILHPFNVNSPKARSQFIITKSELNAMGIQGGTYINSMSYDVVQKGNLVAKFRDLRIRMACTGKELFQTSTFDPNVVDEVMQLDSFQSVQGVNTFNFDRPYYWDGETNLIIEVCFNGETTSVQSDNVRLLYGTLNQWAYYLTNQSAPTGDACDLAALGATFLRPKVSLGYCSEPNYSITWSPTTFLSPTTGNNVVASNVNKSPMTWTVTAASSANGNCKNSKTITVYHDKSSSVDAKIKAPDYKNGAWQRDSVVLCENPSIFYLEMDTIFSSPNYSCSPINTICPRTLAYQLSPMQLAVNNPLHSPLTPIYRGRRSQYFISASELNGIGLEEGEIKSLAWNIIQKNSTQGYRNFSIKMGCTGLDSLSAMQSNTSLVTVYNTAEYTPSQGWDTFQLQKHYGWDGSQNLIIEFCYYNGISGPNQLPSSNDVVEYSILSYPASQYRMTDSNAVIDICPDNPAGTYLSSSERTRPNFKFEICKGVEPLYYWTPGDYVNDTTKASTFGIGVNTEYIHAKVRGRNGCWLEDSVKVVTPKHSYEVSPLDTFICSTDEAMFDAGVGEKAYRYQWLPSTNVNNPTAEKVIIHNPVGGSYPYEVIWTDTYGCQDTGYVVLNVWDTPVVNVVPGIDTIKYGDKIVITATGGRYFSWSPIQFIDNPYDNVITASPIDSTVFTVISVDTNGCKGRGYSRIYIDYDNPLYVPNAFSPNNDQVNDYFSIENLNYQDIQVFQVYDRWGALVYDFKRDGDNKWDGKYNGVPVDIGVYTYLIRVVYKDGKIKEFKGDVSLLR